MIDLSIIILSYNTRELLKNCILSIKKHEPALDYEIIVVDNASTDATASEIRSAKLADEIRNLKIIENKKNLGFSKANNIGVTNAKGRYILFLNADTLIYSKTLQTMLEFMEEHKDAGAATCRIELPTGQLDDSCHRGFPTPWRAFCYFCRLSKIFPKFSWFAGYSLSFLDLNKIHEIDSCSGAFMIVRRRAGEEIDWWDEDFFWYGDDLDFCYRLKERGWKVYFVPTVKILHYKGVSSGIKGISKSLTRATRETRLKATNARFGAMRIFYQKHYLNKYPRFLTWLIMQAITFKHWLALRTL